MPTTNVIIVSGAGADLAWQNEGSGTYQYNISKTLDFITGIETTGTSTGQTVTYVPLTEDQQYFWRIRFDSGGGYGVWHDVNSFYQSSGTANIGTNDKWTLVNGDDITDTYTLGVEPLDWEIYPRLINRTARRNLRGDYLSEWIVTKDDIILDYKKQQNVGTSDKAEILRFYNLHTTLYITRNFDSNNTSVKISKVWKVEFVNTPQLERSGNLSLSLREV